MIISLARLHRDAQIRNVCGSTIQMDSVQVQ
jgi:hypothetical protein